MPDVATQKVTHPSKPTILLMHLSPNNFVSARALKMQIIVLNIVSTSFSISERGLKNNYDG